MKNCNNILIIHLQVCCCDAVKKVEQVEKVEQIEQVEQVVGVSQLAFEKFLFVEQSLIFNQIQRIPKHMPLPCLAKKLGTYSKPVQLKVQKTSNLLKEKVKHGNKKNKKKPRELYTKRIDASCPT